MKAAKSRFPRLRCLLKIAVIVALVAVCVLAARVLYALRDRDPSAAFTLDLQPGTPAAGGAGLRVGFGRAKISPEVGDPKHPVWLAGFSQNRAATAVHDDLWAMACVLDDGERRLGVVVLDAIGLFHEDVTAIRRRLDPAWKIHYAVVCATHNHSTPDLMGLWGPHLLKTGVVGEYRERVLASAVKALGDAVSSLEAAQVSFHQIAVPTDGLVTDTRKPHVYDPDVRVMHFSRCGTAHTLGSIVTWGNHPETVWGRNTEVTSDYCGYLRDALEKGVQMGGRSHESGLGGTHLYINGAVGGLMTTSPSVTVRDPYTGEDHSQPSHEKARAVGHQLASRILPRLRATNLTASADLRLGIRARTIDVPLDNVGFLLAPVLGLMDRGHSRWMHLRTEVALVTLGEASVVCVPGEIYPELVNGGIERAPGGDFNVDPVEVPPLRELMPGRVKFVFGLANDEIGYIIPKSEWDRTPPHLYGSPKAVYGEVNSVGPEVAGKIHAAIRELAGATRP